MPVQAAAVYSRPMQPPRVYSPEQTAAHINTLLQNLNFVHDRTNILMSKIAELEVELAMHRMGRQPTMPPRFRAQFSEDMVLWSLFKPEYLAGKPLGLVIEVGAFDGLSFSVSYGLECAGWPCLLIEGIPQRAEQCKANRPGARVVHAALGRPGAPATTQFTVVDDQFGGMLSYNNSDKSHIAQIAANQQRTTTHTVPQTTMNELLRDETREIDIAVIDVEGGEPELLAGFDLLRYKPKVLLIEDNTRLENSPVHIFMSTQPYTLATWVNCNRLYIRTDLASWLARLE